MSERPVAENRRIVVERTLPHAPETVWRVLTESGLISEWLMPNDFEPVVGHRFTFQARPWGKWDGVVHCEVLECDPPHRLRYSWVGGAEDNGEYGSKLDTIVTWTLQPVEGGTALRMENDGFGPGNEFAHDMMSGGWTKIVGEIGHIAERLE